MNAFLGKTPFLRLLAPVIVGILAATQFTASLRYLLPVTGTGLAFMLLSYFIQKKHRYRYRWLFGAGLSLFLFSIGALQYVRAEKKASPYFPASEHHFVATLLDIPERKPRTMACRVETTYPIRKQLILYMEQSEEAQSLAPGEEILFKATLQPFTNMGNPDDFDYVRFMQVRGFSGTAYLPSGAWSKTGRHHLNLNTLSQRCRSRILDFYHTFHLDPDALAFISAITLGYKVDLSDNLQEAFRASGTAHILAVSGLHVGIIYLIINALFSFLGKRRKWFVAHQVLVIITLWLYALIAGMSPPIVRAAIMLTLFCIGKAWNRSGFTYNTLAAAAFFILLIHPFSLFDISFQMSFTAVIAIIYFQPILRNMYTPRNKAARYVWDLSIVSLAAQLGVFPLVLYYFGTFPTYFFFANLLVIPLLSLVIYAAIPLIAVSLLPLVKLPSLILLESLFKWLLSTLIQMILRIVHITETLPYAQLSGKHLSLFQLIALLAFVYLIARFFQTRNARTFIVSLASLQLFLGAVVYEKATTPPPSLVVFNKPSACEIGYYAFNQRHYMPIHSSGLLPHPEKSIVMLTDKALDQCTATQPFPLDVLILSRNREFNLPHLLTLFAPSVVVLDSSFPRHVAKRLQSECIEQGVSCHDVSSHGAYSIYF